MLLPVFILHFIFLSLSSITNPLQPRNGVLFVFLIMGHHYNLIWKIISLLFLIIPSLTQVRSMAKARAQLKPVDFSISKVKAPIGEEEGEGKMVLRARIGSKPPRCERRCSWCGHCEAIQVPTTNPQEQPGKTTSSTVVCDRDDDATNYKPMSWKCKCGSFIFNP